MPVGKQMGLVDHEVAHTHKLVYFSEFVTGEDLGLYLRDAPEDSKILSSQFSILVKSIRQNKIYKMPLFKHSLGDLFMHLQCMSTPRALLSSHKVKNFFVFKLLHSPLTLLEAWKCLQSFAVSVIRLGLHT